MTTTATKILAIGDLHFKLDNVEESEHLHLQTERWLHINSKQLKAIVILGDVLHSHEKIFTFAMNLAVKFIKMCSGFAPVYVLVGNHDATSNTIFCTENHWMNVLKHTQGITVVDRPTYILEHILACPFVTDGRFKEALDTFAPGWSTKTSIIFAHQLLDGCKMGPIIATGIEKWDESAACVISGHAHDHQQVGKNIFYTGSSQQVASNESTGKSYWLVDIQPTTTFFDITSNITPVTLDLKERKVVHTTIDQIPSLKLQVNCSYKIVIQDTEAAIKVFKKSAKYKDLCKHPQVKQVNFKIKHQEDTKMQSADDEASGIKQVDFLAMLQERVVKENNQYLSSYVQSLIMGTEDLSDKDVVLM